ncbi:serine/threonine-protein kinase [Streptomyces lincolnensis]|uniref:serine/threonine-protein kinase n=1 Tax=Streptomyces lincolnensis TaxID=1915 RepID=UPI0037D7E4D2
MSDDGGGMDPKGRLLDGRYRLVERMGAGGTDTVWRARDEVAEREVAVKQPGLAGDPEDEEYRRAAHRLQHEARAVARVEHPAAVRIHDVVVEEEDGLPWIVMELIRGESLHEMLGRGPLPPVEAARIGLAVLGALRAAHSVGIVHRDVKPANVLLGPDRRVVLTDFGLAHVHGEDFPTGTGESVASPDFVAPERMSGAIAGPACDLWSLGALLHTAVDGRSPFGRTTPEATLAAILTEDPPPLKEDAGDLGPLIQGLLAKDPGRRPDAEEVAWVLGEVAGEPEPEPSEPEPESSKPERNAGPESGDAVPPPDPHPAPEVLESAPPPRHRTLGRISVALLGVLLAGGIWLGTSFADGTHSTADGTHSTAGGTSPTAGEKGPSEWVAHRVRGIDADLSLPPQYTLTHKAGEPGDDPQRAVYSDNRAISVRFTEWDRTSRSLMDQSRAQETEGAMAGREPTVRVFTSTTFHGREALLTDLTYDAPGAPAHVMRLLVRADGDRMYELAVTMPRGTPDEKKGTALFEGARDRLEIGG